MKLLKKLLTGAAVAVAALSMMSCAMLQDAFGVADLFNYSDATYDSGAWGKWSIKHLNKHNDRWDRGGKLLLTQHSDMSGKVTLEEAAHCGPMGVLFNVSRNKDRSYNFCVAAVGDSLTSNNTMQYYVSYFANIKEEEMGYYNFGAATYTGNDDDERNDKSTWHPDITDVAGSVISPRNAEAYTLSEVNPEVTDPYEIMYKDISALAGKYTDYGEGATKVVFIDVKEVTEGDNVGGYIVDFYKEGEFDINTGKPGENAEKAASVTISASSLGKIGTKESKCGVYANVYPTRTLKGSLEIMNLTNDAVIADF